MNEGNCDMHYEVVNISSRYILGVCGKIMTETPDMGLWGAFYRDAYQKITEKMDEKVYAVYSKLDNGDYDLMIGCESSQMVEHQNTLKQHEEEEQQNTKKEQNVWKKSGLVQGIIAAGKYAKFTLHGEVHHIVPKFWAEIDSVGLSRSYECDFEEYQDSRTEDATVSVYVAIN